MQKFATVEICNQDNSATGRHARARLLQYLQALQLPPTEAERLAEEALARAAASSPSALLPAALAVLPDLLPTEPPAPPSLPPQRQSMAPEPLERSLRSKSARRLLRVLRHRLRVLGLFGLLLAVNLQQLG